MKPRHLMIDGYNLLGTMSPLRGVARQNLEQEREAVISRLGVYAQRVGCAITIVFDAWRQSGQSRQIGQRAGVTVIYSEGGEKADHVIQQAIRRGEPGLAVVSSDHEVLAVAKAYGVFTFTSEEFAVRVRSAKNSGSPAFSFRGKQENDQNEDPVRPKEKKGNPRKLPKKVRQRNRIMKKF